MGLTVGRTRRTYFYAGHASAGGGGGPCGAPRTADDALRLVPHSKFDWTRGRPLAVRGRTDGVSFAATANRLGITAGVHVFAALWLPADAGAGLLMKTDSSKPWADVFHVKESE